MAVVAHSRVFREPVPRQKLTRFLRTVDGASNSVVMSNVYRLSRLGLIREDQAGLVPTSDGESYASNCRFVCVRRFGPNSEMAVYESP